MTYLLFENCCRFETARLPPRGIPIDVAFTVSLKSSMDALFLDPFLAFLFFRLASVIVVLRKLSFTEGDGDYFLARETGILGDPDRGPYTPRGDAW